MGRQLLIRFLFHAFWTAALAAALLPVRAAAGEWSLTADRVTILPGSPPTINLFVTITDAAGRAVTGLEPFHCDLREDDGLHTGALEVLPFSATDRKIAYVLLFDHREDLPTSLTMVRRGASDFIERLGFRHRGAVVSYTGKPEILAEPTGVSGRLADAVRSAAPQAGAPHLADGLMMSMDVLDRVVWPEEQGPDRRVLILLTDGRDQGGMFSLSAVSERIAGADVDLFMIGYGFDQGGMYQPLSDLSRRTGGAVIHAVMPADIERAFERIAGLLQEQYVLRFSPNRIAMDGRPHRIELTVKNGDDHGHVSAEFTAPVLNPRNNPVGLMVAFFSGLGLILLLIVLRWIGRRRPREKGNAEAVEPAPAHHTSDNTGRD